VIAASNDTSFGLAASIWTNDISVAHRVAPQLSVGMVWINDWFRRDLRAPFGGTKLSGIGREGGHHSLDFYAPPSNVCLSIAGGV
jgi:aminomuconate-semialdehyde/2-hydroxymuconate-6-semialdehyde dehydrogenase